MGAWAYKLTALNQNDIGPSRPSCDCRGFSRWSAGLEEFSNNEKRTVPTALRLNLVLLSSIKRGGFSHR